MQILPPVTTLKIDKSFVRDMEDDENDRAIIRTVIAMGKTLGKKVLAEGVENHRQLSFLRQMGCDEIQGYLFSKPVMAAEITTLLRDNDFPRIATSSPAEQESRRG